MKYKGKILIPAIFWLVVSTLAILVLAGFITPEATTTNSGRAELLRQVTGTTDGELELALRLNNLGNQLQASLSLDTGNRHAIISTLELPGNLENVIIDRERNLAYLANSFSGIQIVDISDQQNLRLIGAVATPGNAWDLLIDGNTLFVAAARGGLQIIDISSPDQPFIISELILPEVNLLKLAIYKDTIYASSGKKGLQIIDVTNLEKPQYVRTIHTSDGTWGVASEKGKLFISCGKNYLEIHNLSVPNKPELISRLDLPNKVWDMALHGDYLYLPTRRSGLVIADISNLENPSIINTPYKQLNVETIQIVNSMAYLTNREGSLVIFDINNPAVPMVTKTLDLPYRSRNIAVVRQTAFIASGLSGLLAIDIKSFPASSPIKTLPVAGSLLKVIESGQYYYMATKLNGIYVAQKNTTDHLPVIIAKLPIKDQIYSMVMVDDFLYLVCSDAGFLSIDISDPTDPELAGRLNYTGRFRDIATDGKQLYITDLDKGLLTVDITLPNHPALLGQLPLDQAKHVVLSGNRAYVASVSSGLTIIDIANPANPQLLGSASLPWPLRNFAKLHQLTVSGDTAYLAAGFAELILFDLADEMNPEISKIVHIDGEANAIAVDKEYIFVTTRQRKLWVLQKNESGDIRHRAVIDSIGSGYNMILSGETVLLANGMRGLTFLPLPKLLDISYPGTNESESLNTSLLKIKIPKQLIPGTYNLALFESEQLTEFVGAVTVVGKSEKSKSNQKRYSTPAQN